MIFKVYGILWLPHGSHHILALNNHVIFCTIVRPICIFYTKVYFFQSYNTYFFINMFLLYRSKSYLQCFSFVESTNCFK